MCPIYKLFSWSPLEQYFDATWCNIDEIWCNMTEHDAICCNVLYHIILLHDILNPGPIHHGSDQVGGRPRGGSWPLFFFWNRHFRPARCGRRPSANVRSTLACLALTSPQPFVQQSALGCQYRCHNSTDQWQRTAAEYSVRADHRNTVPCVCVGSSSSGRIVVAGD